MEALGVLKPVGLHHSTVEVVPLELKTGECCHEHGPNQEKAVVEATSVSQQVPHIVARPLLYLQPAI